uniref:Putative secreted protein n=1 Tax=Anopheles darlingi TaxID=43151 RepID=A0A2M4D1G6_ANODA
MVVALLRAVVYFIFFRTRVGIRSHFPIVKLEVYRQLIKELAANRTVSMAQQCRNHYTISTTSNTIVVWFGQEEDIIAR